jgi:hypothetical protein
MTTYWVEYVPANWRNLYPGKPIWNYLGLSSSENLNDVIQRYQRAITTHKELALRIVNSNNTVLYLRIPRGELPYINGKVSSTHHLVSKTPNIEIQI